MAKWNEQICHQITLEVFKCIECKVCAYMYVCVCVCVFKCMLVEGGASMIKTTIRTTKTDRSTALSTILTVLTSLFFFLLLRMHILHIYIWQCILCTYIYTHMCMCSQPLQFLFCLPTLLLSLCLSFTPHRWVQMLK